MSPRRWPPPTRTGSLSRISCAPWWPRARPRSTDPVDAAERGITEDFRAATDYGPDGHAARADLMASTLAALGSTEVTSEADRLAADFLRERLEAELAWHRAGEPLRGVRAPFGLV